MKLDELNDDERLALVGLLKLVVRADSELSAEEAGVLRAVADTMGQERFATTTSEAKKRFVSTADIKGFAAKQVKRPEARRMIYRYCRESASPDGVSDQEKKELGWLARTWKLKVDEKTLALVE